MPNLAPSFAETAPELTSLLVCPACRGQLAAVSTTLLAEAGTENFLHCAACSLAYPVRDGIPVMLVEDAVSTVNTKLS